MKPKHFFRLKYIVFTFIIGMVFSCTDDADKDYLPSKGKEVTIKLALSEKRGSPQTYSMPADESVINTIDVLSFIVDPAFPNDMNRGTFFYQAITTYNPGESSFTAILSQYHQNQTLVILVNSRQALQNVSLSLGESKASVMAKLVEAQNTAFNPAAMTEIPMWGHIPNQTIDNSYTTPGIVKLVRMLSRINIVNNEPDFVLKTAFLYNPREKGTYIPNNWDETNGTVLTPTQPTGAIMPIGTNFMYSTNTNKFTDEIYTFEADNKTQSDISLLNSTCIVIGGDYTDGTGTNTYYYRIDLINPSTEAFYDVLRNHSYNITINQIDIIGTDTPDQAYKGLTHIKATVEEWNDMNGNVTIDGTNHLNVSQNLIFFDSGAQTVANTENKITIQSTADWEITDYPVWVVPDRLSGAAGTTYTVNIIASASLGRQGTMKIVSGNLSYTVNILQAECGINGFPLRQRIGNNVYRTYRYGTACWMVENSREGTASATMFDGDIGKTNGNYYTYTQSVSGACPAGWSLPNNAQWNVLQNAVLADPQVSGKWWAGQIGFYNSAYGGYYQDEGWLEWGESGVWWINGANRSYVVSYYGNNGSFMSFPNAQPDWIFSVRCIKN